MKRLLVMLLSCVTVLAGERFALACNCPSGGNCCNVGGDCFGQSDPNGCWFVDPCGREPGFNALPSCGSFVAANDVNPNDPSGPIGEANVACGACPMGNQLCGAELVDPFSGTDYFQPNWCIADCQSFGAMCGTIPAVPEPGGEPWGAALVCGTCGPGLTCTSSNQCCTPSASCSSAHATCGTVADGCGNTLTCGTCAAGAECVSGACCVPVRSCAPGASGTFPDGCGGTFTCRSGAEPVPAVPAPLLGGLFALLGVFGLSARRKPEAS